MTARVNDGSELFGPESGNGFSELAAYDTDGNGWIDESDPVYRQLEVWTKDAEGNDSLSDLKSMGVGAIYLASARTDFELTDDANESNGQVSKTGIYVEESGRRQDRPGGRSERLSLFGGRENSCQPYFLPALAWSSPKNVIHACFYRESGQGWA